MGHCNHMIWNTVNVLGISCTRDTAIKLAGKILNVLPIYRVGMGWVLYPFPCNVLVMFQPGTPPLAPSDSINTFALCPAVYSLFSNFILFSIVLDYSSFPQSFSRPTFSQCTLHRSHPHYIPFLSGISFPLGPSFLSWPL